MDPNRILQHLVDISKGECSITEESILELNSQEEQSIELGLLTLYEEIQFKQKKLERTNLEKEILLNEIQLRVKNNLQLISSLLKLSLKFDSNPKTAIQDSIMRIQTMSQIHEKIYATRNISHTDLGKFLGDLIKELLETHTYGDQKINLTEEFQAYLIDIDSALYMGILINEIILNSLKHGFPDKSEKSIYLKTKVENNKLTEILIGDNGIGFDDELFCPEKGSLGIQLIFDLVEQLNCKINKVPKAKKAGTHYIISC